MLLFEILVIVLFLERVSPLGLSLNESHCEAVPHEQLPISVNHKNEDTPFLKKTYVEEDVIPEPDIESNLYPLGEQRPDKFLIRSTDDLWFADIQEVPSYAGITFIGYFCGGNLISESDVLTSARCLVDINVDEKTKKETYKIRSPDVYKVKLGSTYVYENNMFPGDFYLVRTLNVHPGYMKHESIYQYKNVGLIQLQKNVKLSINVAPAEVHPSMTLEDITKMKGTTCYFGQWSRIPGDAWRLHIRRLKVSSFHKCQNVYQGANEYEHICFESNNTPPCEIMYGSGVFCNCKIVTVLHNWQNCTKGQPVLLTRVDNIRDFIISVSSSSSQMTLLFTILITSFIN